ncbi:MAG: hypothetical protein J6A98_03825 [Clostridia bacterium]|nr:hypothetical protein [Clostridia bacterium]
MDIVAGFQALIAVFPKIVYLLTMSILGVIDVFQLLFRKLAGLDCYYVDGTAQTGDLIYDFLRGILFGEYPILSNVFFGLLILGFILLFLSTIVAIIRNEYTTEKADNTKGKIIGKAFKSVIYFAIVPVVVLFGVYLANVVLVAVDRATTYNVNYGNTLDKSKLQAVDVASVPIVGQSTGQKTYTTYSLLGFRDANGLPFGTTTTTFSGTIFKAAAYGANRVRTTMNVADETQNFGLLLKTNQATNFNGLFSDPSGNLENIAVRIDIAFADNVVFAQSVQQTLDYSSAYAENNNPTGIDPFAADRTTVYTVADKFDVGLVWYYYDLWQFNYIIALGAAIIMVTIFINIIFGLMRRIIEMIGLFLMAPPLIALMPLDNEKAYGSWRGSFIKKALMAYGAVGGMNIILLLLPELQKISFFNITPLDWIVNTLLVLVALLAVKDFIDVVSGFAGGENAQKSGEGVGKDVADLAAKGAKFAASTIGVATSVGGAAVAGGRIAKDFAVAGKRKAQSLMHGAGSTHNRQTKIARDRLKQEHEAEARAEAEDNIFNDYKERNIVDMDTMLQRDDAMVELKKNNGAAYQKILIDRLRKQYEFDKARGADIDRKTGGPDSIASREDSVARGLFGIKQSKVNVTYQDFYDQSEHGKYRKERAEQKALIAAADTRTLRRERKRELNQLKYNYYSQMALKVSQPVTNATKNFYQMTMNTLMDNAFMNTLRGKDGENIEDIGHRLRGHTKAEIDKIKAAQKEEAKDTKRLLKEQDMLLSVLRQIEKEKNSEKE